MREYIYIDYDNIEEKKPFTGNVGDIFSITLK